jgi:predicted nucleotidyltransferase
MELLNNYQKRIIELLLQGNKTLSDVATELGISKPGASKYLKKLEELNMIRGEYERNYDGRTIRYQLQPFHIVISIDPDTKTAISFTADDVLDGDFFLLGNVPQKEFRREVKEYLKQITEVDFIQYLIILYGSVAMGSASRKSDIDILIIKDKWTKNEKDEILQQIAKATTRSNHQAKPLFLSFDEFKTMDKTLKKEIKDNGIIIYEKGKRWNEIKQELKRYKNIMI